MWVKSASVSVSAFMKLLSIHFLWPFNLFCRVIRGSDFHRARFLVNNLGSRLTNSVRSILHFFNLSGLTRYFKRRPSLSRTNLYAAPILESPFTMSCTI